MTWQPKQRECSDGLDIAFGTGFHMAVALFRDKGCKGGSAFNTTKLQRGAKHPEVSAEGNSDQLIMWYQSGGEDVLASNAQRGRTDRSNPVSWTGGRGEMED